MFVLLSPHGKLLIKFRNLHPTKLWNISANYMAMKLVKSTEIRMEVENCKNA